MHGGRALQWEDLVARVVWTLLMCAVISGVRGKRIEASDLFPLTT
jgi:hypothetical protein